MCPGSTNARAPASFAGGPHKSLRAKERYSGTTACSYLRAPPPRTKWTRRVPHSVLIIGHAVSPTPY